MSEAATAVLPRPPAVSGKGLRKTFGYREVLRGIDLEVPAAGCFAIFGHNGAGKSTLLKIIAGLQRPTRGSLEVLGCDALRAGPRARAAVGAVFHEGFLRGDLTLEENLRFYGDLYGLPPARARRRGEELAARLGLSARRRDPVRTYSQGMARRAALARSLLHEPRLWILDEPFSGLDPAGCALLEEIILEMRAERAVLLVTHDLEAGARLAQECLTLEEGRVRAEGKGAPCSP